MPITHVEYTSHNGTLDDVFNNGAKAIAAVAFAALRSAETTTTRLPYLTIDTAVRRADVAYDALKKHNLNEAFREFQGALVGAYDFSRFLPSDEAKQAGTTLLSALAALDTEEGSINATRVYSKPFEQAALYIGIDAFRARLKHVPGPVSKVA